MKNLFKILTLIVACAFVYVLYLNALTGRDVLIPKREVSGVTTASYVMDTWTGTKFYSGVKGIEINTNE